MILPHFATLPHPFKGRGNKQKTGRGEGPTLLGVGLAFPHCQWTDGTSRTGRKGGTMAMVTPQLGVNRRIGL